MKKGAVWEKMLAIGLCAAMLAGLAACGGSSTSEETADASSDTVSVSSDDDTFNVTITEDPSSLDPTQANDYATELVANNLYDTLLVFSDDGTELEPGLAESWEQVDELTYIYQIRQGVYFWDGNEMTAEDVAYSLSRHMDADNASLFAYMFDSVESIEVTGDYEVTVTLFQADTSFMYVVATMAGAVAEKAFIEENGDSFGTSTVGTMATGPYVFESWTSGSTLVFTKNENYWDEETQWPADTLEFDIIEDLTSAALAMTSGQVDFMNQPTYDVYEQLEASDAVDLIAEEGLQNSFVMFNCSTGPFSDENVRKAAAYAIDAAAIALASKGEGYYTEAGALDVDPEVMGYYTEDWVALQEELEDYEYDLEKAMEYLAASDYPDGFECTMPTCTLFQKESEAIQYYLSQIGITVNLETVTFNEFCLYCYGINLDDEGYRDYDLLAFAWFPDYSDPIALLNLYYSDNAGIGGSNMSAYSNEEFDALLDLSDTQTGEERSETMMEAYRILNEDCASKMISYFGPLYAVNSSYTVNMSPMWMWNFDFTKVSAK